MSTETEVATNSSLLDQAYRATSKYKEDDGKKFQRLKAISQVRRTKEVYRPILRWIFK